MSNHDTLSAAFIGAFVTDTLGGAHWEVRTVDGRDIHRFIVPSWSATDAMGGVVDYRPGRPRYQCLCLYGHPENVSSVWKDDLDEAKAFVTGEVVWWFMRRRANLNN